MRVKDAVGRHGEELAARHLLATGYEVVERNWRCPAGELDIVARRDGTLVFVEVKTRSTVAFGVPAEAVSRDKARRIRGLAARWLVERRPAFGEVRFDVVSVLRGRDGFSVEHVEAAF